MDFQRSVNVTQAVGVPGDFASQNPRSSLPSQSGGWLAGPNGVTVGCFAWMDATGIYLSNSGTGAPSGFIGRAMQALITSYLGQYSMTIPAGFGVGNAFTSGDYFVLNSGSSAAVVGMKAFANNSNGTISFAATGTTVTGSTETKYYCVALQSGGTGAQGEIVVMSSTPL